MIKMKEKRGNNFIEGDGGEGRGKEIIKEKEEGGREGSCEERWLHDNITKMQKQKKKTLHEDGVPSGPTLSIPLDEHLLGLSKSPSLYIYI